MKFIANKVQQIKVAIESRLFCLAKHNEEHTTTSNIGTRHKGDSGTYVKGDIKSVKNKHEVVSPQCGH